MSSDATRPQQPGLHSNESVLDILKMILAGAPLREVLTIIARLVETQGDGMLCAIWFLDEAGKRFFCEAAPSLPPAYIAQVNGVAATPTGTSCGAAVFRREPVYVTDIRTDPLWEGLQDLATAYGLRACWSWPLISSEGKVLGTFANYYRQPRSPSAADLRIIENAWNILTIAIDRHLNDVALARSQDQLQRSEAFLAEGQRLSRTGSFSWRVPTNEITWSEELYRIFDFEFGTPVTLERIASRVHPEDMPSLNDMISRAKAAADDFEYEHRLLLPDATIKYVHLTAHAIRGSDGRMEYIGAAQDVTHRRLAEEQLRKSELNLRQMTETIPEMLWSATPDGAVDYCNSRLLEYSGFPPEAVMGNAWAKLIHPDDVEQTCAIWTSCITTGAPYRVEVRTIHAADRSFRWCVTSALPLRDKDGRILKWHGTVVDMHDWKQSQEALRNTQAELANIARVMTMGQLTASIAHELNQPLSGIITNASTCLRMLHADSPNIEGARETARRTIRDGNRAADVIARLRALFTKKAVSAEVVNLNEVAREVVALVLSKLQRNGMILRTEFADDLPLISGDRVQLQQVIMNLLQNASDAMIGIEDRPKQLLIKTERHESDSVRLTVRDTGVGFDPHAVERLFHAFYTTKSTGMGIGLSLSRSIVENHQGRLSASLNDGPGATFSFFVPRRFSTAAGERAVTPREDLQQTCERQ